VNAPVNADRRPNQKARDRFPGAGFNSCDGAHMQVICPTWQVFSWASFLGKFFLGGGDSAEDL